MHVNVRDYEPPEALFVPDDDPLRFYRAIGRAARRLLRPDGRLWFEIYERLADETARLLADGRLFVNPGSIYGAAGEGFIRLNIACPRTLLADGLERLKKALTLR